MFGAMEFGRLLYLWNTVQEVTLQCGAFGCCHRFHQQHGHCDHQARRCFEPLTALCRPLPKLPMPGSIFVI
ncbi:hypothetical protein LP417_29680 [Polaromonas sp. P1-6]|nr:hypothetical protein LP417_29680 [Polaromonas sp. P1-6]